MLPALDPETTALPPGRFSATLEEVKQCFVDDDQYATSKTRSAIWGDFENAVMGLRQVIPVVCVWLGGSFLTTKLDPDDIDVVFWCHDDQFDTSIKDFVKKRRIDLFRSAEFKDKTSLRVDPYIGLWHLDSTAQSPAFNSYAERRGYWDDFWSRMRSGTKNQLSQLVDAVPRRGYVEVRLDGFNGL